MKKIARNFIVVTLISTFAVACHDMMDDMDVTDPAISTADLQATADMNIEIGSMKHDLDSMLATPHHNKQLHWDSMYHHHDSMYWYHHSMYSHGNMHDDHTHSFTPYQHHLDYHNKHHYAGHENDSLITHLGMHHHDSTNYHHHNGHDMEHHHTLDSLEDVHKKHHP